MASSEDQRCLERRPISDLDGPLARAPLRLYKPCESLSARSHVPPPRPSLRPLPPLCHPGPVSLYHPRDLIIALLPPPNVFTIQVANTNRNVYSTIHPTPCTRVSRPVWHTDALFPL